VCYKIIDSNNLEINPIIYVAIAGAFVILAVILIAVIYFKRKHGNAKLNTELTYAIQPQRPNARPSAQTQNGANANNLYDQCEIDDLNQAEKADAENGPGADHTYEHEPIPEY